MRDRAKTYTSQEIIQNNFAILPEALKLRDKVLCCLVKEARSPETGWRELGFGENSRSGYLKHYLARYANRDITYGVPFIALGAPGLNLSIEHTLIVHEAYGPIGDERPLTRDLFTIAWNDDGFVRLDSFERTDEWESYFPFHKARG
ncbi:hypothetical protein [Afipia felis]|uniref:Uncharacterized protein n=2 Tax=Afipia felis TaxID=1035 RepID=A0A380WDD7_AFIFE|nr:hypothetical protein [Afipia felis]EKS29384.1 hypothetical protein HMPREF9697_01912 [Afipia felis ATCC 53690]SUU78092.1 Uncharacterised protein [Afipia felis]SUU86157.1 Uncharacterised protein [Afipia felis]